MSIQQNQSGFSLLIFLVVLMGAGGFALANYSKELYKQVEKNRFEHNQEVLQQAKDALLMFAYKYPLSNPGMGPGRLPCPDDNNDGFIGAGVDVAQCSTVGRIPWNDPRLGLSDVVDANGEHLWYVSSAEFRNFNPADMGGNLNGDDVINSDSLGTITIYDQSGNMIYDGSTSGVAAVIISPGPALAGQDRAADPLDPANYLDSFEGFDNSVFTNGLGGIASGFRLGPVYDPAQNSYAINDQIMVITSDEVVAMMEKAVLEAYRNAVNNYLADTGNIYPWLFNYDVDINDDIYDYPTRGVFTSNLSNIGRIPSMFTEYFKAGVVAGDTVDSELWVQIQFMGITDWLTAPSENFTGTANVTITTDGDISYTGLPAYSPTNKTFYFWDDQAAPDGFELCPAGGDTLSDCNRDASGVATPGSPNNLKAAIIRRVTMTFNSIAGSNTIDFDDLLSGPDCSLADNCLSANGGMHAFISASYDETVFDFFVNTVTYQEGNFYLNSFNITDAGNMNFASGAGAIRVGVRYYPVLPAWARVNDWHPSVQMAYSPLYRPDVLGACTIALNNCLKLTNSALPINNKVSLLTIAGSSNIDDDDGDFTNDLSEIFDSGNDDLDDTFNARAPGGDDKILVVNKL